MSSNPTPSHTTPHATTTVSTTVQPVPVANPMMSLDNWAPLLSVVAAFALICGLLAKHVSDKIGEFKAAHDPVHEGMDKDIEEVRHSVKNERTRIDSLERLRQQDIERIVKVETSVQAIDRTLEKLEHGQEKLADQIDKRFSMLADTIREISKRELK